MRSRTSGNAETNRTLDRFTEELGEPLSPVRTRRATNRVLENLASVDPFVEQEGGMLPLPRMKSTRHWTAVASVAAALLAAAVLVGTLSLPSSAQPIAKRLSGKLIAPGDNADIGEGKLIRTDDSEGEVLVLRDGSRMEMSAGVELSINRAADGIQIDLADGNIIVTAAKQRNGHLYVKTRDCMVSVVGTVFSVKAEATGSRVAVIEGEVHVQHGDVSQTLLQGQQVATNAEMKIVPLQSEIQWSQDPTVQVAMLQQTPPAATPITPAPIAAPVVNPDMVGEIRLILAPVDQEIPGGQMVKSKAIFNSLWEQNREAINSLYFRNQAMPPNGFSFSITGIQGRTISFSNSKGETFSFGCADCSFVVSENGVSKAVSISEPGVEFKLSADGSTLAATCHATPCSMGRWSAGVTWTRGAHRWEQGGEYLVSQASSANPQTFTIPISQLSQSGISLLFAVTKPVGQ